MGKPTNEAPKAAPRASSVYTDLDALAEDALARGDGATYAVLYPAVVALAGAKSAARTALAAVDAEARALLDKIIAL